MSPRSAETSTPRITAPAAAGPRESGRGGGHGQSSPPRPPMEGQGMATETEAQRSINEVRVVFANHRLTPAAGAVEAASPQARG